VEQSLKTGGGPQQNSVSRGGGKMHIGGMVGRPPKTGRRSGGTNKPLTKARLQEEGSHNSGKWENFGGRGRLKVHVGSTKKREQVLYKENKQKGITLESRGGGGAKKRGIKDWNVRRENTDPREPRRGIKTVNRHFGSGKKVMAGTFRKKQGGGEKGLNAAGGNK